MNPIVERPSPGARFEPVTCEVLQGHDFVSVWHCHPECEITLVLRGGSERIVGDNHSPLLPGDMVFLGPNLPHDYRNVPRGSRPATPVEAVVVHFLPNLPGQEDYRQHASMRPIRRLFERAAKGLVITGETRLTATHILRHMVHVHGMKRVILLLQLLDLLAGSEDLQEICNPTTAVAPTSLSDRISQICEYLKAHRTEPFYVGELAARVGLGRSAFSRLFKKRTGKTVPQYVNELRITRACLLLAETDLTVSQIAMGCGFVSPAHFQRQFREHQHCAPLAYRSRVVQSP